MGFILNIQRQRRHEEIRYIGHSWNKTRTGATNDLLNHPIHFPSFSLQRISKQTMYATQSETFKSFQNYVTDECQEITPDILNNRTGTHRNSGKRRIFSKLTDVTRMYQLMK